LPKSLAAGPVRRGWILALPAEPLHPDADDLRGRLQRVEAVLFLAREPLNSRKLAQFAHLADGTEARTLVRRLNQRYDQSGRAFRVEEIAGGFRLLSRRQFAPWLRRLEHVPGEVRLSAPSLETLAVVAYRQPVLRADIEAVRGVSCGEILRQLMEKDLVRIGGRSEELGRPYLYTTTKRFLQLFGLQNLDQLPRAGALRDDAASADTGSAAEFHSGVAVDQQQEEGSEVSVT
jgi:segregation and condensation protein B